MMNFYLTGICACIVMCEKDIYNNQSMKRDAIVDVTNLL